ncbi:DUF600 domain-containing protein [Thermoactinomyces intermedius]|uniref:DUF600 domain-containing protein n=1 Tax=Thermoactinomyces intermedius TaxID=2024 RepID=A0A8I1AE01_THEIN|nr:MULTISPECIES: DUF600 domain-containing protein [Thermoactinomyces]MBA4547452.1 DUF600 domain-containing protein [Thermoactinomyces intermedius]MBA4836122.1 DUF600 domain-containing protein [Thermoactinomyces intermedius]MBH8594318.1 DUF600 domain-containing protein [Thermoactinomyces intermedius]MBH8601180.1 DUF600 domain-containing protein [Thermoactinomyces sp. CICC 23799]
MKKGFEDVLAELQAEMVAICLEYVNNRADDIYIYCSCELSYSFNVFYKINGKVVHKNQLNEVLEDKIYDVSKEKQWSMLHKGVEILKQIHNKCKEFNREMPTEIKMHYKVKENKLRATYKYDLVWSNDDMLLPDDIFLSWFEEVRQENNAGH